MNDRRLSEVRKIAAETGWVELCHQSNIFLVSFTNGPSRINVYYSRMTVATIVDHPKFGRNQMFRKHVSFDLLRELFKNPRKHTLAEDGIKGYHANGKHIRSLKPLKGER